MISGRHNTRKTTLALLLTLMPLLLFALECNVCGKQIRGNYIKSKNKVFCSRSCFRSILPKCFNCDEPCEKSILRMFDKTFCSKRCMHAHFKCSLCGKGLDRVIVVENPQKESRMYCADCRNREKCFFCMLPCIPVPEVTDRNMCGKCYSQAVTDEEDIRHVFNVVRRNLARLFNFDDKHKIELKIVTADELKKIKGVEYTPPDSNRIGLMQFSQQLLEKRTRSGKLIEKRVTKEICRIYLLTATPRAVLIDAIAHELTHDHIRHTRGKVNDLAAEEGFCELVAYLHNSKIGNGKLNKNKEVNKDPVYGGGFRKMRNIYRKTGSLEKTLQYVR